jgi:urease accessory protein
LLLDHDQMKGIITMKRIALIATLILVSATPALAHAGHGIASGFLHPLLGWDHLIAMLAVGAWGATLGARAIWSVPAVFVSAMIVGGAFGMAGTEGPFVETMILASVIVLAAFAVARVKLPVWSGMAIVGLFALAHGYAHGAEIPAGASAWVFSAGFIAATSLIHALGAVMALAVVKVKAVRV